VTRGKTKTSPSLLGFILVIQFKNRFAYAEKMKRIWLSCGQATGRNRIKKQLKTPQTVTPQIRM
jgi:hypothetical protein